MYFHYRRRTRRPPPPGRVEQRLCRNTSRRPLTHAHVARSEPDERARTRQIARPADRRFRRLSRSRPRPRRSNPRDVPAGASIVLRTRSPGQWLLLFVVVVVGVCCFRRTITEPRDEHTPAQVTTRMMATRTAADRPVLLRASLLLTVVATLFRRPAEAVLSANATPEYIHSCRKADAQLNSCIKETFNHLRPYLINGIDELTVPPIEPLVIPKMQMENGHGAVRVRAILSNMTIHGASNYTVLNVRSDMNKYRIDLGLFIPHIEATGNYDVNGNVLLLPVRSRGEFWASFENVTALAKMYGVEVKKEGVKFMKTERLGIGFKLEKSDFQIKDSINRQNVIGEAMNVFLNENSAEIIEEMKPAASQAIGKHFKNFLNNAFLQIPLKVWLKDSD